MSKTIEMLKNYKPYNAQEEADKQFFIECEQKEQILTRQNSLAHLCASAVIINKEHTKLLCIYHNIYKSWCVPGGHADGDDDMLYVAKKEAEEETSIKHLKLLSKEPIAIDALPILAHVRRGKFVNAHVHLSVAYLFEADEKESIKMLPDENSGVEWLTFDELINNKCTEIYMLPVYKKIFKRIKEQYN